MAAYNKARFVKDLLQKTEGKPPSFVVNLYPDHWSLNNGSRFHYHIPMASLLDDIRAQRIPVDFLEIFDNARIPFYEGCMVVQIEDYRPQNPKESVLEKAEQSRVVLHPNSESLWADICLLNQRYGTRWTDIDALEVEARISLATAPPLCLDPDPHLARVANHIMRASMPPIPSSLKRKAAAMEPEDDENDKARRIKIIQHMATRPNRPNPSFHLFDALQKARQNLQSQKSSSPVQPQPPPCQINTNPQSSPAPAPPGTPTVNGVQARSPTEPPDDKKRKRRKSETPQANFASPAVVQTNGTQTPVPPTPITHQFVNTHLSPSTAASSPAPISAHSPMQIPMYTTAQGMPDSTLRGSTPAQQPSPQYTQSPRPPSRTPITVQHPPVQPVPPSQPQPPTTVHRTPQGPKVPLPTAAPASFPTQSAANQQFLPQHAQNGGQKPTAASNIAALAARIPQTQNLPHLQQMQLLNHLRLQQQHLQAQAQKPNGRVTPQGRVRSPALQSQAASPLHQAASPQGANQSLAAPMTRSPLPPNAPQLSPAPTGITPHAAQQAQSQIPQTYVQTHQAAMPRSPAQQQQQQPVQAHGQHSGYAQFSLRGMMPANPSAAHQALQTAVVNAAAASGRTPGRTPTPGSSAVAGIPDHRQYPPHPTMQGQPPTVQHHSPRTPQPLPPQAPQTPNHQPQPPAPQHPQQPQQPLTQAQMQMYAQMYGYSPMQFNVPQGGGARMPGSYWSAMPNVGNMAGIPGMQGVQGMQGIQGMQGMQSVQGMQSMGRGPTKMPGMAAAGVGAGHVHGAGGVGPMQGKTAGVQR